MNEDHVGGNLELKEETGCHIVGGFDGQERIPGIDTALKEGQIFTLGKSNFLIMVLWLMFFIKILVEFLRTLLGIRANFSD